MLLLVDPLGVLYVAPRIYASIFFSPPIVAQTMKRGSKLGPASKSRTARPPKGARSDQEGGPKGSPFQVLGVARAPQLAANPVHVASLIDLCHLKQAELDKHLQKETGRVVLLGDIAKDDKINQAVFTERGQSITFSDGCSNILGYNSSSSWYDRRSKRRSLNMLLLFWIRQ